MLRMKVLRIHLDRVWLHLNYVWDLVCLVLRPAIFNIQTKLFTKFNEFNLLFFDFLLFSWLKPLLGLVALFRLKLLVKKLYDFNFCLTVFLNFWYLFNFCRLRLIQVKTPEARRVKVRLNAFWMNEIDNEVFWIFIFSSFFPFSSCSGLRQVLKISGAIFKSLARYSISSELFLVWPPSRYGWSFGSPS